MDWGRKLEFQKLSFKKNAVCHRGEKHLRVYPMEFPQGSILGPILFWLILMILLVFVFANDTTATLYDPILARDLPLLLSAVLKTAQKFFFFFKKNKNKKLDLPVVLKKAYPPKLNPRRIFKFCRWAQP